MQERSLSAHLLSWILPFILGVSFLISASNYLIARRTVVRQLEHGMQEAAQAAASQVEDLWDQYHNDVITISQSPLFKDYVMNEEFGLDQEAGVYRREIEKMLLNFSRRSGAFPRIRFLDLRGREVCRVQDGAVVSPSRVLDPKALEGLSTSVPSEPMMSGVEHPGWHRWPTVAWAVGVHDDAGRLAGAVVFDASLGPTYEALRRFKIGRSGSARLTEPRAARPLGLAVASAPVSRTPWSVVLTVDRREFVAPLWRLSVTSLLLALIAALVMGVGVSRQLRYLLWPIGQLAEAASAFAEGALETRVEVSPPREVGMLARSFNEMAASLKQRTDDLVQRVKDNARLVEETRVSAARYRLAVENSPHAVVGLDQNMRVTLWNRRSEALFGYQPSEADGRTLDFLFEAADYRKLRREVEIAGAVRHAEIKGLTRDGRALDLNVSWTGQSAPAGVREWFVVIQDETEKKRLLTRLIQSEKLSAVGRLIAGVAHELNNPLTAVAGFAEMLRDAAPPSQDLEDLRLLHANAMRCRDIIQSLLSFVRQESKKAEKIPLNYLVEVSVGLLEYRLVRAEGVLLEVELDPAQPQVGGDFTRLQQLLVNLLANAGDAVRGRLGRRLVRVRTRILPEGCEVSIEDNGPGIVPHLRERIFEPFFTTKPSGSGTGLGLWISSQVIAEAGGSLRCEQSPEGGARFVARFPPCPAGLQEARSALSLLPPRPGAEVLVVDDEPEVAQLMARLLVKDGMKVEVAVDEASARRALASRSWDLVVADVDLGTTKGFALVGAARAAREAPAFVFVTGDVLNPIFRRQAADLGAPLLAKPFLRTEFLRVVRRALPRAAA